MVADLQDSVDVLAVEGDFHGVVRVDRGDELLMERLRERVTVDFVTARRLFTLVCALHQLICPSGGFMASLAAREPLGVTLLIVTRS